MSKEKHYLDVLMCDKIGGDVCPYEKDISIDQAAIRVRTVDAVGWP